MSNNPNFNPKYMFLKGSTGKKVFFPGGDYWKGYIIENSKIKKKLRLILIPYLTIITGWLDFRLYFYSLS